MNLLDINNLLRGEILTDNCCTDCIVHSAFCSDMMSNVLAYGNDKSILITALYNPQVLRTAEMMGMSCVVFIGHRRPEPNIITLANTLGICVILTRFSMFTTCGKLYNEGLNGGIPSEQ